MLHLARSVILSRMHLSSIPFTSPVGKLLRRRSGLCRSAPSCLCLQGELRGRRWIRRFLYAWLLAWDYEHENQRLFVALVPANGTVYDIGANVGFYTLLAAAEPNAWLLLSPLPRPSPISSGTWT